MRLLVCGGRDYRDRDRLFEILERIDMNFCIDLIIEGGQKTWCKQEKRYIGGADHFADEWANLRGCPHVQEPADWDQFGKRAGMIRNKVMLDKWSPTRVLAMKGGVGTKGMIDLSQKAGIPVWIDPEL